MKKHHYFLIFFGLLCVCGTLTAQTLSNKLLPAPTRKALKNFAHIEGGTFTKGLYNGSDSLNYALPLRVTIGSFYLYRYEVSVAEYQEFLAANPDRANRYDSTVWMTDFRSSDYNEPMVRNYFIAEAFRQYPVIGVTWEQAQRYCVWKTDQLNQGLENSPYKITVRLPSEAEWTYAALSYSPTAPPRTINEIAKNQRIYPWNGLFLEQLKDGLFRTNCNSGPLRTPEQSTLLAFNSDGFLYTAPVKSFKSNDVGLYQMAGNVAEWTADDYAILQEQYQKFLDESEDGLKNMPELQQTLNSLIDKPYQQYKMVKGGSWVDNPFYIQAGVVKVQRPDKASSTTGFRPALVIEKK